MTVTVTPDQIRVLTDWRARTQLAADAAERLERFGADVARVLSDEDGSFGEVLDLAEAAVERARAAFSGAPDVPDPGHAALIAALGGPDAAVGTLLAVLRQVCEVAP